MTATFLDALIIALDGVRFATGGGAEHQPAALLWPDQAGEWEPLIPYVSPRSPVLILGDYKSSLRRGPAYWLRCVVDGVLGVDGVTERTGPPIIYLPGIARASLRAIEDAPAALQPIAELQYRGVVFSQTNGRDWTVRAFLQASEGGGLGIDTAADGATRDALRQARSALVNVEIERLRAAAPLRATFFQELLAPDIARSALEWLNDPQQFQATQSSEGWSAFVAQFRARYRLDPTAEGPLAITEAFGKRSNAAMETLWRRYRDAPAAYPGILHRLREARPKATSVLAPSLFEMRDAWPQVNEEDEALLRTQLTSLPLGSVHQARVAMTELEQRHGERRGWVWAQIGHSPLAMSLKPLVQLAELTVRQIVAAEPATVVREYADWGWQADDAAVRALATVSSAADLQAVGHAVRALYSEWLDSSCSAFQRSVADHGYKPTKLDEWALGTCLLFTDGLRFDVGQRLKQHLLVAGIEAELQVQLSAMPSITSTAKSFVSPVAGFLGPGVGLTPRALSDGQVVTAGVLRKQLASHGYEVLVAPDTGDPKGRAWSEAGDIDSLGHEQSQKLPTLIDGEIALLVERIAALLQAGWAQVVVVTDHGWLYLPGGLPKVEMPQHITQDGIMRKARCGRLAVGAVTAMQTIPWTWDPSTLIAIPPGASAFQVGQVFEHGGLSLQECVTPIVIARLRGHRNAGPIAISVHWRGMRADLAVTGAPAGARVDLRLKAGDAKSSLLDQTTEITGDTAKILVTDGDRQGTAAFLVVLDNVGNVSAQERVTVGENE